MPASSAPVRSIHDSSQNARRSGAGRGADDRHHHEGEREELLLPRVMRRAPDLSAEAGMVAV
jgi:hypothetical protein